jgi:CMP-N-acetylneuraminic acid synthetase
MSLNAGNLILIPARSGSTRVKDKNVRRLGDRPLLGHVVDAAAQSRAGRVVVSTDSSDIAEMARRFGAETPFLRPKDLSHAHASSVWCILHALEWFGLNEAWEPEIVAFCPPTNPFLSPTTVARMCEILAQREDVNSIVTIAPANTHPFTIVRVGEADRLEIGVVAIDGKTILDIERSQDWPRVWRGSAACRASRTRFFTGLRGSKPITAVSYGKTYDIQNAIAYEIDAFEAFDIDDEDDWLMAEHLATARRAPSPAHTLTRNVP